MERTRFVDAMSDIVAKRRNSSNFVSGRESEGAGPDNSDTKLSRDAGENPPTQHERNTARTVEGLAEAR